MTMRASSRRRILATGSRFTAGVAVIAAGLIGLALAIPAPLPQVLSSPAQTRVLPQLPDTSLVCPGPFRAIGRDAGDALAMQVAGTVRLTAHSEGEALVPSDLATPGLEAASGPVVLLAEADAGQLPQIAAAQSAVLRDADLFGLAAAACRPPSMQAWLVGGSATVGAIDVLLLAGPGTVPSTVTLTVFGAEGPRERTVIVPARSQIAVPLAASAAGELAPIVRLLAEGAPVHAVLQSSLVRTLDPAGVDLQDDAGSPATRQVLAGVQVVASDEGLTLLRLMATEADTIARVTVVAGDGTPLSEQTVPLQREMPAESALGALPPGVHTVIVEADSELLAAVWQATGLGARADFSWMTPAPTVQGEVLFAVPQGPGARLHVVNDGAAEAEVTLSHEGGERSTVTVPAGGAALVPLRAGSGYLLASDAPVHTAVIMAAASSLAGWPLWQGESRAVPILVWH